MEATANHVAYITGLQANPTYMLKYCRPACKVCCILDISPVSRRRQQADSWAAAHSYMLNVVYACLPQVCDPDAPKKEEVSAPGKADVVKTD